MRNTVGTMMGTVLSALLLILLIRRPCFTLRSGTNISQVICCTFWKTVSCSSRAKHHWEDTACRASPTLGNFVYISGRTSASDVDWQRQGKAQRNASRFGSSSITVTCLPVLANSIGANYINWADRMWLRSKGAMCEYSPPHQPAPTNYSLVKTQRSKRILRGDLPLMHSV